MTIEVKTCGIKDAEHAAIAAENGADYLGFIFFAKSPRNLSLSASINLAPHLPPQYPDGPKRVGVFVNADLPFIEERVAILSLDMIQLHGRENPAETRLIKGATGLPVIKAIAVSEEADLEKATAYEDSADMILFDAKPPKDAILPGGNAVSFPWHILKGKSLPYPWLLAGGLTPENALNAVAESGAKGLDVSSGIEESPGKKSSELIKTFLSCVKDAK